MKDTLERYWHTTFELGVLLKAFNGVWEIISGVAVLFISRATLSRWVDVLAQRELAEDPRDVLTNAISHSLQTAPAGAMTFAGIYILFHGLLNIFLVVQLYRKKLWAYIFTIWAISISVVYQIYRISLHHSPLLSLLTILDILFVVLTWHEYLHQKKKLRMVS